jgi:hypothetical protein
MFIAVHSKLNFNSTAAVFTTTLHQPHSSMHTCRLKVYNHFIIVTVRYSQKFRTKGAPKFRNMS